MREELYRPVLDPTPLATQGHEEHISAGHERVRVPGSGSRHVGGADVGGEKMEGKEEAGRGGGGKGNRCFAAAVEMMRVGENRQIKRVR